MRMLHGSMALLAGLSNMVILIGCGNPRTEVPPSPTNRAETPVVKPAEFIVVPEPFSRNASITVTTRFKAPIPSADYSGLGTCSSDSQGNPISCEYSCNLLVRVYPVDDNDGERPFDENNLPENKKHIAQTAALNWWPQPAQGSDIERQFEPFAAPGDGGEQLYFVLWRSCLVPSKIPAQPPKEEGTRLGGAKFKQECSGGKTTMRCVYIRN